MRALSLASRASALARQKTKKVEIEICPSGLHPVWMTPG
jgi:hypothetical protein